MSYAELHCLSNFSFLRSASHPEELVQRAAEMGYRALAITDECSLAGVVKAHLAAKHCGLPLIIGAEFLLEEGCQLVLIAPVRSAYAELSALITLARRRSPKGSYTLRLNDVLHHFQNGFCIWKPRHGDPANADMAKRLRVLEQRLWIGVSLLYRQGDAQHLQNCREFAAACAAPLLACGDVHMHCRSRKPLQDVLTAIRLNQPVQTLGRALQANAEQSLRPIEELQQAYPRDLLLETLKLAARCHFSLDELQYNYPKELVPEGMKPQDYLRHLTEQGVRERWPNGEPPAIREQIEKELQLIRELDYEYYFLTVYDIVAFARSRHILCQGRGSAANSVVCYCLMITEVNPDRISLLFERFISKERDEPPDIDVDFEHERREEVIQYIYKKYGRERAALAATLITYRPRSAIRDVGKALGLDPLFVKQLSKSLAWWDRHKDLQERFRQQGIAGDTQLARQFFSLVQQILGFPRHLSQHVGGFIITQDPISSLVPVENASMPERTVIQWDKESIEAMRLLKMDVLALGMLTAIRKCLALLGPHYNRPMTLADIPPGDRATYDMLCKGDSTGVFQVESRAQMSMLPRLKPRCFYDLVVEVAIVRPGPIQGDMVHPYLRRRQGLEAVEYPNAAVKAVLERTLGVPIFQEQVIKLAMVAAGFSGGEADQLRRAMASWGKNGHLNHFEQKLLAGMRERGHSDNFARRLFRQMQGFGAYGFPESHAASFALLVYVSAWLKAHYPAAFYCALLNSQPMGFYSPSQLVQDARRHGIEVRPVDVAHSDWDHRLEGTGQPALRLGMRLIKGLPHNAATRLTNTRSQQPFSSITDLKRRCRLATDDLALLTAAGALASLEQNRHQASWRGLGIEPEKQLLQHEYRQDNNDGVELLAPSDVQTLTADYNHTGLTLGPHPMALLRRQQPEFRRCIPHAQLKQLPSQRFVRIAGLVTGRQRPGTASGVVFLTLEDETGNANVVVWKGVQERQRQALLSARLLLIKGVVESSQSVTHVIAGQLLDYSHCLAEMDTRSRDFH